MLDNLYNWTILLISLSLLNFWIDTGDDMIGKDILIELYLERTTLLNSVK